MSDFITWTGSSWRPYRPGDESHVPCIRAPFIRGTIELNPEIWVITLTSSKMAVEEMHSRFRLSHLEIPR